MKTNKTLLLLGLALVAAPLMARAEELTPEQVEQHKYVQDRMNEEMESVNARCGSSTAITLDWASLKGVDTAEHDLKGLCAEPVASAMKNICSEGDAYKASMKKIKKVHCVYAGAGNKKSASASAGTLTYKFDWELIGAESVAAAALKKAK